MAALTALALSPAVRAQSYCASDGQPAPTALVERFISADCESCWARADAGPPAGALVIDWIVPSARGDEAPLSAAASTDAVARLRATGQTEPGDSATLLRQTPVRKADATARLRVAHGLPLNNYLGASIELKPVPKGARAPAAPWTAWLALVETIGAGTEGTPVARHLVRNLLVQDWDPARAAPAAEPPPKGRSPVPRLFESRPMGIPEGARPERLQVVGWVQDATGRVVAAAQSRCIPSKP